MSLAKKIADSIVALGEDPTYGEIVSAVSLELVGDALKRNSNIRVSVEYPDGGRVFSSDYNSRAKVFVNDKQVWPEL